MDSSLYRLLRPTKLRVFSKNSSSFCFFLLDLVSGKNKCPHYIGFLEAQNLPTLLTKSFVCSKFSVLKRTLFLIFNDNFNRQKNFLHLIGFFDPGKSDSLMKILQKIFEPAIRKAVKKYVPSLDTLLEALKVSIVLSETAYMHTICPF